MSKFGRSYTTSMTRCGSGRWITLAGLLGVAAAMTFAGCVTPAQSPFPRSAPTATTSAKPEDKPNFSPSATPSPVAKPKREMTVVDSTPVPVYVAPPIGSEERRIAREPDDLVPWVRVKAFRNVPEYSERSAVTDAHRAPTWLIAHARDFAERVPFRQLRDRVWMFQDNRDHIVVTPEKSPAFGKDPALTDFQTTLENFMTNIFKFPSHYSYGLRPPTENTFAGFEGKFDEAILTVAVTKNLSHDEQVKLVHDLARAINFEPHRIELTVPPRNRTGTKDWVEGYTLRLPE